MSYNDSQHDIKQLDKHTFVDETGHQLSEKEIRQVVTPHAFRVADSLIGKPLASPWRRGIAMAVDGTIIAGLSSNSLFFIIPIMASLIWNRRKAGKIKQMWLAVLVTLVLVSNFGWAPESAVDADDDTLVVQEPTTKQALKVGALGLKLADENCDYDCVQQHIEQASELLDHPALQANKKHKLLKGLLEASNLTPSQNEQILQSVTESDATDADATAPSAAPDSVDANASLDVRNHEDAAVKKSSLSIWQRLEKSNHSLLQWVQGILADFGVGFGWAVFYFTFLLSWNHGRTPGKWLMGIRVVQLDHQPISLWGAFSRQGGYGAGFATGLVGFAQIFWDPNRQAIQDKVAGTLVIRQRSEEK